MAIGRRRDGAQRGRWTGPQGSALVAVELIGRRYCFQ